ncbi:MAG: SGNH/GDSL hydrolase family protein [Lachnospiraceae bacterium]|nr:SGNH/GDSL hydrolase family protein [Lachnospiraceae bacterium]
MKISVFGDSISSYSGYSNGVNGVAQTDCFYPANCTAVGFNNTWWMQVINYKGASILSNNAVGGSCVGWYYNVADDPTSGVEVNDTYHVGPTYCMNNTSRINYLGQPSGTNHPDAILFLGGYNDGCRAGFTQSQFFANYGNALQLMNARYGSNTKIICITPYYCGNVTSTKIDIISNLIIYATQQGYANCLAVDLRNVNMSGKLTQDHPNLAGMNAIAQAVEQAWP